MSTIIHKTVHGLGWSFKSQISIQGVNFIVGIIMMRILTPDDFGKFAMVMVVISFFQVIRDGGISAAIVQRTQLKSIDLTSAFWWQFGISFLISCLIINAGDWFNRFYETKNLDKISFWMSIDFLLGSVGLVPISLLRKELKYKALFKIHVFALIISSLIGVGMALSGMAYLSLVGKILFWTLFNSIGALYILSWRPKLCFSIISIRTLLRFGIPATGNRLLSFLVRNVDDFLIGRVIGPVQLGLYNRAYSLMLLPLSSITSVLQNVLFSSWAKIQNDKPAVKKMFIQTSGMVGLLTFPLMVLLAIFAPQLISMVLGEQWLLMTRTFRILAMIGMLQSVTALVGVVFMVFDQNKILLKINMVTSLFTILLLTWSVYKYQSIEITAAVYGLSSLIILYPIYYFTGKLMKASFFEIVKPLIAPLILSLVTGVVTYVFSLFLPLQLEILKISLSAILGILVYLALCFLFRIEAVQNFRKFIKYYKKPQ